NVACGDRYDLNYLYGRLQALVGSDLRAKYGPARPGDVKHSQADIEAVSRELAFDVEVSFEDGLERTVKWYQDSVAGAI
ncbi:MAG: LPS biosynthesis protein WbpP, partial [Candidatus Krumholzibacteria bacterium]|nr:LPS biosynthesis protein WbpP [Candidatus Krumholzibacteria bacterium]